MWSDQTELPANRPSDWTVNVGPHYQTWQHWFPTHTHTRTHTEDSESLALDLTWQERLLLSLTSDPFLPVVPSAFAPPCFLLSFRTNVIEGPPLGQVTPHFLHTQTQDTQVYVHLCGRQIHVRHSGVDVKGLVVAVAEGSSSLVVHVSRTPPVPAHHASDSTDLFARHALVFVKDAQTETFSVKDFVWLKNSVEISQIW